MRTTKGVRELRRMGGQALAFGAACGALGLVCGPVSAQDGASDTAQMQRKVTIDARKTSLLEVVSQLMKQVHANYTLDGQLQDAPIGAIHLEKVAFHTALEVALKASGKPATFRLEQGVFMVISQPDQPAEGQANTAPGPGQPGFVPGGAQGLPAVGAQNPPPGEVHVSISAGTVPGESRIRLLVQNGDLYTTLKALFNQARVQFTLDPSLRSIYITANINQPFRNALETLLRASGQPLTYKLENDVYSIVPKDKDDNIAP